MAASADLEGVADHFFAGFGHDLPLHAFAWFVGGAGDFVKGLVEGEVVSDGVLPACGGLVAVVRVAVHDEGVDAVEVEFAVWCVEDGLRDHLGVAVLGLDVLVVGEAEVRAVGANHDGWG